MVRTTAAHSFRGVRLAARFAMLFVMAVALAAPSLPQSDAKQSFLAVQQQVEAVQANLIKSTIALRLGGVSGSGVIISPDGYVLTAAHVIAGPEGRRCQVILSDGRRLQATVLGSNKEDDFGVIKIQDPTDLSVAPLGDSSTLRRGQWILSTGHPLGLRVGRPPVLRIGRVTGVLAGDTDSEPHRIATDAPLISGDSGGPLFDLNGRVVGINSMITQGGRRMSSIHIPVNLPKSVLALLEKGETVETATGEVAGLPEATSQAEAALRAEDYAAASRLATKATEIDPTSAAARLLLARTYARAGNKNQAVSALEQAVQRGYNNADKLRRDDDFTSLGGTPQMAKLLARLDLLEGIPGERKTDRYFLAAAVTMEQQPNRGVVRIQAGDKDVALGTVMSSDGDIFTKASELPAGALTCVLPNGQTLPVERKKSDADWDLALLKVKATGLETALFTDIAPTGAWTFSPDGAGAVAAVGLVGVQQMQVLGRGIAPKPTAKAYMGVQLEPIAPEYLKKLNLMTGVLAVVQPDLPAARAGIQTGDIFIEADGKPIPDPDTLMDLLVSKKPGDSVSLKVAHGEERKTVVVNLTARPAGLTPRGGLPEMLSGEVSRMAGPFDRVLHHDAVLKPSAMGGPLLDAEGRCIGINIARADRTSTYAIPTKDLKEIYGRLKGQ